MTADPSDLVTRARKLAGRASLGPWKTVRSGFKGESRCVADKNGSEIAWAEFGENVGMDPENAEFIAQSRELVPALVDEIERLREENAQLLADRDFALNHMQLKP